MLSGLAFIVALQHIAQVIPDGIILSNPRQIFEFVHDGIHHILASDTDIDARSYQKMRGLSMDEVKRTNGRIDFEDALLSERGV